MRKINSKDLRKDEVVVTCYGKTKKMERQEAILFYQNCLMFCDSASSEAGRYMNILQGLFAGGTVITDID